MCIYVCFLNFFIILFFLSLFFSVIILHILCLMLWAASIDGRLSSLVASHYTDLHLFNLFVYLANKLWNDHGCTFLCYRERCNH